MRSNDYSRDASLRRRRAQRSSRRRGAAGLLALALAGALAAGGTVAWLSASTGTVTNEFEPGEVTTDIVESFDGGAKRDVEIKNTGNVPVYVRAKVIVNWTDAAGNVVASVPGNYSYEVEGASGEAASLDDLKPVSGWAKGRDGFWYYTTALAEKGAEGDATTALIGSIASKATGLAQGESPEYFLSVDVLSEAVQALPDSAFNGVWGTSSGLTASDGRLTEKTTA